MSEKHLKIEAFLRSLPPTQGQGDPRYLGYFQCFNQGLFYEAHDVLEDLWLEERKGPRDGFYKGLIQLAGAFVHLQKNRLKPARALFELCQTYLRHYTPRFMDLNVQETCHLAQSWAAALPDHPQPSNPLSRLPPPTLHPTPTSPAVHLFCKLPQPGSVKTRLAATVGPDQACRIYQQLLTLAAQACQPFPQVTLDYTPHHPEATCLLSPWLHHRSWSCQPQATGNLGDRLTHAIQSSHQHHPHGCLVIGSDCPEITAQHLHEASLQLQHHDVVLGPAHDGGYWLIGLKSPHPELFQNISWSTDQVLVQTLDRIRALGLSHALLTTLHDMDTEADWNRWRQNGLSPSASNS